MLFLDLDRFKLVNDSLGHDAGDRLLTQVAQRMLDGLRASDTVARLGGDEFVVVVEDVKDDLEVHAAVQRVAAILEQPFEVDSRDALREREHRRVGRARRGRGGRPAARGRRRDVPGQAARPAQRRVPDRPRDARRDRTASRASPGLHRALERDELVVYYQPIVDIRSRLPVALEALVRWNHPELGLVPPGDFIPLAEDTGLIVPLGWRVLEHALRRLQHRPDLAIAVNVSARQLSETDFVPRLTELVASVPRGSLTLEITESLLIDDPERIAATLAALDEVGVRIALDDFGTGYSSLSNLSALPIHQLKIDRSFVSGLGERPEAEALVSGIINLGHGLELEVVAEGVETEQQARRLERLDCDFAQGYFFGRPEPWADARTGTSDAPTAATPLRHRAENRPTVGYGPVTGICEGRIVIVTGAGRGIGREHALGFAREGARVVVNDLGVARDGTRRRAPGPRRTSSTRSPRSAARRSRTPTTSPTGPARSRLVQTAIDTFGGLDVLVNNAGFVRDRMLFTTSEEEWDAVIRVHLKGHFAVTRHASEYWRARSKAGEPVDARIVNTSSGAGLMGSVGQGAYSAAKGGIAALTLVESAEMGALRRHRERDRTRGAHPHDRRGLRRPHAGARVGLRRQRSREHLAARRLARQRRVGATSPAASSRSKAA